MSYVDGFVFVVPKKSLKAYKKMASEGKKYWMKAGAVDYYECMLDDAKPKHAKLTFPQLVKLKKNETAWFSFIIYKSRKHRDQVNARIHKAMEKAYGDGKDFKMPFDEKKMAVGGFKAIVKN